MKLQPVSPTPAFTAQCIVCKRRVQSDRGAIFADIEGTPWQDYYCAECAKPVPPTANAYRKSHTPFVGQHVVANGYSGTITKVCDWSDSLVEVRLASGVVCVDFNGTDCFAVPTCRQCARELKFWLESRRAGLCTTHGMVAIA